MEYEVETLEGVAPPPLSVEHAVRQGGHDAVKMLVQYGTLALIGALVLRIDPLKTVRKVIG